MSHTQQIVAILSNSAPMSCAQIAKALGITKTEAWNAISTLVNKGVIRGTVARPNSRVPQRYALGVDASAQEDRRWRIQETRRGNARIVRFGDDWRPGQALSCVVPICDRRFNE